MTNPTKTRRQFTALQKQEADGLCLAEGLTCRVVAQRLGNNTLAKWVRQARIDRSDIGATDQGQLTSDERAELNRLRKENSELKREKDFSSWRQRTLPSSSCRRKVSLDQQAP
ncbi:MAG: transposase [Cyanobacteria bacterium]|nr:transposase [Cyanobacteriota bacterium]